jgi:hypothetical protein
MSSTAFGAITILFLLSPVIFGGLGLAFAAKITRLRWLLHIFVLLAMPFVGPFLFVWAIGPSDGSELNPGVGMIFLPFFAVLAASAVGYIIFAFALWSRSHPPAAASNG